ncbi:PhzF family phenazine biosynthesis protein [Acidithiobacillus sp.]|uniref:PhzF family phenazine biosynthesis protein n=1 Tax=Acidithiobacillus sp. TaxID=1872118 RepID=UPI0025BB2288|nr:PhzF family phenazine biosynthesis protein [Acidithiobacillus sp.]
MKLMQYQIDAFSRQVFSGNPAAVVPLDQWLPEAVMQAIAEENHLSETAFYVPAKSSGTFYLRWFTPAVEVDLCGHATLATAHVLFQERGFPGDEIAFDTRSGILRVKKMPEGRISMDFPLRPLHLVETLPLMENALGQKPLAVLAGDDYVVLFRDEAQIRAIHPDMTVLLGLDLRGVVITAPGKDCDFVARFFGPKVGVPEDPVTGSAYTALAPYWAKRLGKTMLNARQISQRGGEIHCGVALDHVTLTGAAATFMVGEIRLPEVHEAL